MVPVIDMHCDTIALIASRNVQAANKTNPAASSAPGYAFEVRPEELTGGLDLRRNRRMIDLERMKKGNYMCQSFAMYVNEKAAAANSMTVSEYLCFISDLLDETVEKNSDLIRPALSGSEIEKNFSEGFMSALKTVEEGLPYGGKVENLREMYRRGVRKSTLTWNYENELAFGHRFYQDADGVVHMEVDTKRGLKPAGFEFVEAMEEMGMLIDVSHLNDAGIRDIFNTVKASTPIIASHSNARAVCNVPRNLPDEFLKAMADHGGITGINFSAGFLSEQKFGKNGNLSRIEDMITHIKYIRNLAGIDVIGLGTDFDGITSELEIDGCGQMQKLAQALDKEGFSDGEIEKIYYKNALRVYKEVLG